MYSQSSYLHVIVPLLVTLKPHDHIDGEPTTSPAPKQPIDPRPGTAFASIFDIDTE